MKQNIGILFLYYITILYISKDEAESSLIL